MMIFATNHGISDQIDDKLYVVDLAMLRLHRTVLKFGLATVTCCVSGHFYKRYPRCKVTHTANFLHELYPHYRSLTEPLDEPVRQIITGLTDSSQRTVPTTC